MDISQYLTIANTTSIDANARIDLNTQGGVSAVDTSKIGRLGERIIRSAADAQHYTQVRQNFLDSLKTLYGVTDQSQLPKMVMDAFKDEEVVCGKPLTKRRITAVLDAVRRHLDYSSIHELSRGVAEQAEDLANKAKVKSQFDLNDEGRMSLYPCTDDENENPIQEEVEAKAQSFDDFEIVEHEEVAGLSLSDRIWNKSQLISPSERDRFAANISGKFVGAAADNLMKRFDKFMKIYGFFLDNAQQSKDNYVTDWLERIHQALTTSRKGNNDFANRNVIRAGWSGNESIFLSAEQMNGANGVDAEAYSLDEAIGILQKWQIPDVALLKDDEEEAPDGKGFDLEAEMPVFDRNMALSFNDPKLTKKVLEGAKKFETYLRNDAKAHNLSKAVTERYVSKGMDIFNGKGPYVSVNKNLGELWTVSHQRLEHPENKAEFDKEMSSLRSVLILA